MKLLNVLKQLAPYRELVKGLEAHKTPFVCTGLSHIHKAHFAAGLRADTNRPVVLIAPDEPAALRLCEDIAAFEPGCAVLHYPAREWLLRPAEATSREYEFLRMGCLEQLRTGRPIVVASAEAAMQTTISPDALAKNSLLLKGSFDEGLEGLVRRLSAAGYTRVEQVEGVCTYAVRGGIADFWAPGAPSPVRVEFWGDEIDSMAWFSAADQRRGDICDEVVLTPAAEAALSSGDLIGLIDRWLEKQK